MATFGLENAEAIYQRTMLNISLTCYTRTRRTMLMTLLSRCYGRIPATVAGRLTERSELRKESHDVYLVFFDAFPSLWRQLQDPAALSLCTVTVSRWWGTGSMSTQPRVTLLLAGNLETRDAIAWLPSSTTVVAVLLRFWLMVVYPTTSWQTDQWRTTQPFLTATTQYGWPP